MTDTMTDTMTETATETATEITLDAPALLAFSEGELGGAEGEGAEERRSERAARLLEAGDYPDKGLRLTEDDLDGIVARFDADAPHGGAVPVKVEHVDSPLDPLGHVRRVWREGSALFGTLAFPDDLAAFLRRRGAAKLSVGLARTPLALREVSLVLRPRVAGAVLMGEPNLSEPTPVRPTPGASADPSPGGKGKDRAISPPAPLGKGAGGLGSGESDDEIIRLRAEIVRRDVDAQVAAFKAQGRIVPASEAPARALLAAEGEAAVTLSEGPEPIARVFRRFLEAQPPVVSFGEVVATAGEAASVFTQDEHMFLSKRLGVDPDRVAALIREEKEREAQAWEDQARRGREKGEGHAH